ncbi:phytanoyl-CoA dioxygenase family protein [Myxococcota bacterium]|nr:phytanoyl-CoA dioxygenase family protein [Myxococcota bacterium]
MPTNSSISDEMLEHFQEDGFVVARGLLHDRDLQGWLKRLEQIVEGTVEPAEGMLVMKDVMVAKGAIRTDNAMEAIAKLQDYEHDPILDRYTTHPRILDCIERFVGHDVMTIHTMLINKPPNVDGRHPLHQDLLYFPFRPAHRIVAAWTALERVTVDNGCLTVVPGSHRGKLREHENLDWEYLNGGYFGAVDVEDELPRRVHLEMEPGDTAFFQPTLLHGSGRNRTAGYRRAISAHYASIDVTWSWRTRETYGRRYRILRGSSAGQEWQGDYETRNPIDPVSFFRAAQAKAPPSDQSS